jgi:hypothetical protein
MYFPEANVLVPQTTDPASRTPGFKSVVVTVEPAEVEAAVPGRRPLQMVGG